MAKVQVNVVDPKLVAISTLAIGDAFYYEFGGQDVPYMVCDLDDFRNVVGRASGTVYLTRNRCWAVRFWDGFKLANFKPTTNVRPADSAELSIC